MTALNTGIITGVFGLLVAITTIFLTQLKENQQHKRDKKKSKYESIETLYLDTLTLLEQIIRHVKAQKDSREFDEVLSRLNARWQLAAPKQVLNQYESAGDAITAWSAEYFRGQPKKLGYGDMIAISSQDSLHQERAEELYPKIATEMNKLTEMMHKHLETLRI